MTERTMIRIPTARDVLTNTEVGKNGVIISKLDYAWSSHQTIAFEQLHQPRVGAEIATYITTPLKMIYQPYVEAGIKPDELPPYEHSCLPMDEMLFGAYPNTRYLDVSRGGPLAAVDRSIGYLARNLNNYRQNTDERTIKWIEKYGLGTLIPLVSRKTLFQWTKDNEARAYLVPATSIAEGVVATSHFFPKMNEGLQLISDKIPWLTQEWRKSNKGSSRLYEVLYTYILEKHGPLMLANMLSGKKGDLNEVAGLFMRMAEELFLLGREPEEIYKSFAERLYDPTQKFSDPHYGSQADCSEVVVRADKPLTTVPWEGMLLLGDGKTTTNQLLNTAELLKKYYPNTSVIVLLDKDNKPLELGEKSQNHKTRLMAAAWIDSLLRKKVIKEHMKDFNHYGMAP